jgi:gliding motility-associated-like protein
MKAIITVIFIFLASVSDAQKQGNIWYFGSGAGLDFNSGSPSTLTDGQTYDPQLYDNEIECSSAISDSSGALLFYTNGMKIWNTDQQVMPNGDGILGNFSSTQGALIVPQPGSSRYFYVFTVDDGTYDQLKYGFRYSIVDICLNNGLGDVIAEQKNILVLDTVAEKLAAVRHANGTDYWIIVHKYFSDAFYSYHLSASGITDTVVSHIGSRHPSLADSLPISGAQAIGQMKLSPDGTKLALVNANSAVPIKEYFSFDKNTGIVSNWVDLQTPAHLHDQYYGVSFSPDNSKLYICGIAPATGIDQFDLTAGSGNRDSVIASARRITTDSSNGYLALQLATDNKIYVTRFPTDSAHTYLGAINFPNVSGFNCQYIDSAVSTSGRSASMGLPTFVTAFDYSNTTYDCNDTGNAFIMPDAFTPNGDGKNELFYPVFMHPDTSLVITFKIYNRWGQLVYDDPSHGWDGTYQGQPQAAETYTYFLSVNLPDPNNDRSVNLVRKAGNLVLIR